MRIRIDPHTLERSEERGATEEEIHDVIETGLTIPAKHRRIGKAKVYEFKKERHGIYYEQKRVEVFYPPTQKATGLPVDECWPG